MTTLLLKSLITKTYVELPAPPRSLHIAQDVETFICSTNWEF